MTRLSVSMWCRGFWKDSTSNAFQGITNLSQLDKLTPKGTWGGKWLYSLLRISPLKKSGLWLFTISESKFHMLYKEQINNSLLYSSTLSKVQNYKSWFTFHFVVLKVISHAIPTDQFQSVTLHLHVQKLKWIYQQAGNSTVLQVPRKMRCRYLFFTLTFTPTH